jgi:hypothetical protein
MPVSIEFINGSVREFPKATDAFRRGGLMIVTNEQTEIGKFDASEIIMARISRGDGSQTTVPGSA